MNLLFPRFVKLHSFSVEESGRLLGAKKTIATFRVLGRTRLYSSFDDEERSSCRLEAKATDEISTKPVLLLKQKLLKAVP